MKPIKNEEKLPFEVGDVLSVEGYSPYKLLGWHKCEGLSGGFVMCKDCTSYGMTMQLEIIGDRLPELIYFQFQKVTLRCPISARWRKVR